MDEMVDDQSLNALYRLEDADGEPLPDGAYDNPDDAIDRRAREMAGDTPTVTS